MFLTDFDCLVFLLGSMGTFLALCIGIAIYLHIDLNGHGKHRKNTKWKRH